MKEMGRMAFREEGRNWNAYYATPGTMKDAIFIGSINLRFVEDASRRQIFMSLMQEAVGDLIEEITGARPTWPKGPQPAPESERSGNS